MITVDNLQAIVREAEGQYLEKKSAKLKLSDLSSPICAFANASGGTLIVDVEDDGTLTGFRKAKNTIEEFIYAAQNDCQPPVRPTCYVVPFGEDDKDVVLVIEVKREDRSVVKTQKGEVKLRVNDKSLTCTHEQIKQLEVDKGVLKGEDLIINEATMEDLDPVLLDKYRLITGATTSCESLLRARGLLIHGKLTAAALLLFGKNPTQFLPHARVRFLRYDGVAQKTGQHLNITKDVTFDSAIPVLIQEIKTFMETILRDFNGLSEEGKFVKVPEYPPFTWLEGIVNAVTHRDYLFEGEHIKVRMFDDRLEILSPGKLPNMVTLETIKTSRYSRNSKLARVLCELGFVKELNEGVNRIFEEMKTFYLEPPIFTEPNNCSVQLTLKNNIGTRSLRLTERAQKGVPVDTWNDLDEYEKLVLKYLHTQKKISNKDLRDMANLSQRIASRVLGDLADRGLIKLNRKSLNDPSQHYTLVD